MRQVIKIIRKAAAWSWNHKVRASILLLLFIVGMPKGVKSQFLDPCCAILATGLTSIGNTLSSVVGGGLNSILGVDKDIFNFERSAVWDPNAIASARSTVGAVQGIFNQVTAITKIRVNSATLPASQQLEQVLLSHDPNTIGQIRSQFTAVYGPLPDTTAVPPEVRNQIDMSDSFSRTGMGRSTEIDAIVDQELGAMDELSQQIQVAAPGSAPILEAEADVWLVRSNAYTQMFTADLMRMDAALLAAQGANLKSGSAGAMSLQQEIYNLLKR